MRKLQTWVVGIAIGFGFATMAQAQGEDPIVIAQTAAFTGGPSPSVIEMTAGAKLIIDAENAKGGVFGRPIKLVSVDDGFIPARAASNAEKLLAEQKPVALFLSRGTPTSEAMLPLLKKYGVPLIAPSTGAMSLRTPVNPLVFNVRGSYFGEARRLVEQLFGMGFERVGLIYIDNSFGADALKGVTEGFKRSGAKPDFAEKYASNQKDFTAILERVQVARPPALLVIGSTEVTIALLKGFQAVGLRPYVATLSTNSSTGFLQEAGEAGRYAVVSQVFPSERATQLPLVREIAQLAKAAKGSAAPAGNDPAALVARQLSSGAPVSPAMLEGAAAAKVLIAGLKRCNGAPTPSKLVAALENGTPIDLGWPPKTLLYTKTDHSGIEYVDLSIVGADGQFKR